MTGNGDQDEFGNYDDDQLRFGSDDIISGSSVTLSPCSRFVNTTLLLDGERHGFLSWLLSPGLFIDWTPIHHISLQVSQLLLLAIFMLPHHRSSTRFFGIAYGVSFFVFGYFVLHSLDIITWAVTHVTVNTAYLLLAICRSLSQSYSKELEQVYKHIFEKLHITREQFNSILSCKKTTRILLPNAPYAIEKSTRVDSLGLLLSGRLLVSQQGRPLHIILPFQFIDSPEYFGVSTDELFQVTITAVEESKIMVWHRDKLRLTIMSDEFLSIMFDHIIGRDVVRKLIQVSDTVTLPSNGTTHQQSKESTESDPMLHLDTKDLNGGQFGTTSPFESGSLAFYGLYKNKPKSNVFFQCKQRIYQGQSILPMKYGP